MMKRFLPVAIVVVLIAAGVVLSLSVGAGGETQAQTSTAIISPALTVALEETDEVLVLVSLRNPELPLQNWTVALRNQNAAERQARVLDALTSLDFTLTRQFDGAAALGGFITKSGVEKLRTHPDVVHIGTVGLGSWGDPLRF